MRDETRHAKLKNIINLCVCVCVFASQGVKKPFSPVIDVSSCHPHRAGMAPITFVRQVHIVPCVSVFPASPVISLTATN